jgi:hypothetical protein
LRPRGANASAQYSYTDGSDGNVRGVLSSVLSSAIATSATHTSAKSLQFGKPATFHTTSNGLFETPPWAGGGQATKSRFHDCRPVTLEVDLRRQRRQLDAVTIRHRHASRSPEARRNGAGPGPLLRWRPSARKFGSPLRTLRWPPHGGLRAREPRRDPRAPGLGPGPCRSCG